jgi:hypothetical protein
MRSELKGLARILAPLSFWMALGWAAYPSMIEYLSDAMNEAVELEEIRTFSCFMVASSIIAGAILLVYGMVGGKAGEIPYGPCPYCGEPVTENYPICQKCGNDVPR